MNPVTKAVLTSWDLRPEVLIVLVTLGVLFSVGWWRLRRRTSRARGLYSLGAVWRLVAYLSALVIIGISLMSPIDVMSQQLFFMHMIQHLLLVMIAAPLLLITNPLPIVLWGLPAGLRRRVGAGLSALIAGKSRFRQGLRSATGPGIVWLLWVIALIGWHDPNMYNWALRSEFAHDLEHLSFFIAALLFWWHVTGAGPHIHKQVQGVGRIAFVLSAVPTSMMLGVVLAFVPVVVYTYYEAVPRLWGIDPLTDQKIGGIIMWIPGSMMYILAALVLIARIMQKDEAQATRPHRVKRTDDLLTAPGEAQ